MMVNSRIQQVNIHKLIIILFYLMFLCIGISINKVTGDVIVADKLNHRVQVFTSDGKFIRKFGSEGNLDGQFYFPTAVTVLNSGHILVSDQNNHRIQIFTEHGFYIHKFGSKGTGDGQLKEPSGILVNNAGNVVVCDTGNNRLQIFV